KALSAQVAGQLGAAMESAELHLQTLSNNPILVNPSATDEERRLEMIRIVDGARIFSHIVLYDADGIMINATSSTGYDPEDTTIWFQQAKNGKPSVSTPQQQLGRSGLFLNIYFPVEVVEGYPRRIIKGHVPFGPIWKI